MGATSAHVTDQVAPTLQVKLKHSSQHFVWDQAQLGRKTETRQPPESGDGGGGGLRTSRILAIKKAEAGESCSRLAKAT